MDIFNIILVIIFLCIAVPIAIYLYVIDRKDKEAWFKNKIQHENEEKEAEEWVKKSFRPKMLTIMRTNKKMIILYSLLFLVLAVMIWMYFLNSVNEMLK